MTHDHEALPGLLMPEATLHRLVDQLAVRFTGVSTQETIDPVSSSPTRHWPARRR